MEQLFPSFLYDTVPIIGHEIIKDIQIEQAIKRLSVDFYADMEYYLSHRDEMEKDLKRKEVKINFEMRDLQRLEKELIYNNMCFLFGEDISKSDDKMYLKSNYDSISEIDYDKAFLVKDFRILSSDGNDKFATAVRRDHFIIFKYIY